MPYLCLRANYYPHKFHKVTNNAEIDCIACIKIKFHKISEDLLFKECHDVSFMIFSYIVLSSLICHSQDALIAICHAYQLSYCWDAFLDCAAKLLVARFTCIRESFTSEIHLLILWFFIILCQNIDFGFDVKNIQSRSCCWLPTTFSASSSGSKSRNS